MPKPKKIVYIFEIEYGDVLVFSDKGKAIEKALDHLATVFKKKATSDFLDAYKKDIEGWLDRDGETGAMGDGEYSSCYIYKREISD